MRHGNTVEIRIGLGSCGIASGGQAVREALEDHAHQAGADGTVKVVGCNGMCHREPLVEVLESDGRHVIYGDVSPEQARKIVARHVRPKRWLTRARWALRDLGELFSRDDARPPAATAIDPTSGTAQAYLGKQQRIVLENCGQIDPLNLDDYLARGGYQPLEQCLTTLSA